MANPFYSFANSSPTGVVLAVIFVLVVWSMIWKGIALWKAARLSQKKWFVVLLIVNTVGILEIIYIYLVAGKNKKHSDG